jgi:5-methylcytosine-specific restriction enzyme A
MCGKLQGDTSKLACDHKLPHKGDAALFWDEDNCQTLCADPCHNKHKQAQERALP